jgi:hypothetical protein
VITQPNGTKPGADWLAWTLQFIAGFIVGSLIGLYLLPRAPRDRLLNMTTEDITGFVLGAALMGAAFASFFGDRLWVGLSYRILPPDEIKHSATSRIASIVTGVVGMSVLLLPLLRHLKIL